ncbi:hypothetical protein QQS21_000303 [Conoideocrella luteorostrata]|uniref:DUF6598 domain-containing protein n=1 Tax=Conoideocrella luteorostrata TaxID=1105319 RepID=A0AAJ0D126_9HYPO|nr:hypothetical protein QQS21_000303 [Conoideocrella luteorostrata]
MIWQYFLSAACLALACIGPGGAMQSVGTNTIETLHRRDPPPPKTYTKPAAKRVWRGDRRAPRTLRRAGGVIPLGNYWEREFEGRGSFTIAHHEQGPNHEDNLRSPWGTAFVSVSRDSYTASTYGYWLYLIDGTPNMIDPDADQLTHGQEAFALGGILWRQIIGWVYIDEKRAEQGYTEADTQRNPEYDPSFAEYTVTRINPGDTRWRAYRSLGRDSWTNFMNNDVPQGLRERLGWSNRFPFTFQPNNADETNFPGPRDGDIEETYEPDTSQHTSDSESSDGESSDNEPPRKVSRMDVITMADYSRQQTEQCPAGSSSTHDGAGPSRPPQQFIQDIGRQVQDTARGLQQNLNQMLRDADEELARALRNVETQALLREWSANGTPADLCHIMTECYRNLDGHSPRRKRAADSGKKAKSNAKLPTMQHVCHKLKVFSGKYATQIPRPPTSAGRRSAIEVLSVRIDNIDGENPGDLYGQISLADLQGKQLIYDIPQSKYQKVKPGQEISLISPLRAFEPEDKSLNITFDLTDYDWFIADKDDPISQGTIVPSQKQGASGQVRTEQVKGENGAVTIKYVVFEDASIATIKMFLRDADNESSGVIYGQVRASMGNSGSRVLWAHEKGTFDKGEEMKMNQIFGLQRNMVAVGAKDKLVIEADLKAHDWLSPDDRVAKGSAEFAAGKRGSTESKVITGKYGKVEVQIDWS